MDTKDFCYWLEGFLAFSSMKALNEEQTAQIRSKLESCLTKAVPAVNISRYTDYDNVRNSEFGNLSLPIDIRTQGNDFSYKPIPTGGFAPLISSNIDGFYPLIPSDFPSPSQFQLYTT